MSKGGNKRKREGGERGSEEESKRKREGGERREGARGGESFLEDYDLGIRRG